MYAKSEYEILEVTMTKFSLKNLKKYMNDKEFGANMNFVYKDNKIIIDKEITDLDRFVMNFTKILEKYTDYVIVSGYVIIFFGRNRGTEDIDIIIRYTDKKNVVSLYQNLIKEGYDFLNTENPNDMFEMLNEGYRIRIVKKGTIIPNIDFKFVKDHFDEYSIDNKLEVIFKDNHIYISPMELQIPYKLSLGDDKDIQDAIYLWEIFKENIDLDIMEKFLEELKINPDKIKLLLED
jgi:hypothetical protein